MTDPIAKIRNMQAVAARRRDESNTDRRRIWALIQDESPDLVALLASLKCLDVRIIRYRSREHGSLIPVRPYAVEKN